MRTDHLRLELARIGQRDDHVVGTIDHVRVRHHVAVGAQDEAGAHATGLRFCIGRGLLRRARIGARPLVRDRDAETAEELEHVLIGLGTGAPGARAFGGADADHGRADLLDQFGEVGQALGADRRCSERARHAQTERERTEPDATARDGVNGWQ
jgi:hypothetical protein